MAPQLTEDEIDDLIYFARIGEGADLMDSVTALADREKVAPAVILMASKDEGKSTVLHMATGNGHLETVRKVIECFDARPKEEKQAFLDEPNEHGNTGMHWAALGGHLDTVKLLMEHGASPALANERDYVPLDLANQNEKTDVSAYFLSFLKELESKNTDEGLNNATASIEVEETIEDSKPGASS
ncbi:hypothetical protein CCM_09528 [Cordyceps militaris CM01]|uniref:Uncharacterized protein n=2 Tax=Cordyceps militaris TaxID=73501 RepID=G3JUD1_CORMM|nr:uncharacterized protein CCM_09528 [Cordyceps militaris CM01]ATY58971.1 Ankyrin repeat-containing domain [Cordyceps militaris]EGX87905.1 hypothetical protein CCM_09528 [Cordyceps militaris CM01]